MKFLYLVLLCLLFLPVVVYADTNMTWNVSLGYCVTAIDTNSAGSLVLVGLGNGSIFAYGSTGNILWTNATNDTAPDALIKKIVADSYGDIAWISNANESGFITSGGSVLGIVHDTGRNITDVALTSDGSKYVTTELDPPRIVIHNQDGSTYAQNTTFENANWIKVGYDPNNQWMVTANQSSPTLYFWNISSWSGWEEFNPMHTAVKNASQIFLDSFPYRENISIEPNTASTGLYFFNVTNVTYIQKITQNIYFYNPANTGPFFYWTLSGNISNNQVDIINLTNADTTWDIVILRPGHTNYTVYFGNKSYTNVVLNQTWTNDGVPVKQNITVTGSWAAPMSVTAVNLSMYGGGGGGSQGSYPTTNPGNGGTASTINSYTNIAVAPGTSYPVTIGDGGAGGYNALDGGAGHNGLGSAFNNSQTATGGAGATFGTGGAAGAGVTSIIGYPTAGTGANGYANSAGGGGCGGTWSYTAGGTGGSGFGAGGGGGGSTPNNCGYRGTGGTGAPGVIQISYYINDIPIYYIGESPSASYNFPRQDRSSSVALNQSSSKDYVGDILGISVPSTGGIAGISTDTIFYQQYISLVGIGLAYSATENGYPPAYPQPFYSVSVSNSGSTTSEGRGSNMYVYDSGGVVKGKLPVGGAIKTTDSAMTTGDFAVFGGDNGLVYILNREINAWNLYYTGSSPPIGGSPINTIAISWDGKAVVDGRLNGTLEYFVINTTSASIAPIVVPTLNVDNNVLVYVFKNSAPYVNQPVTIYSSILSPYSWLPAKVLYTDSGGKITFNTTTGTYYKFVVNNAYGTLTGEGETIWQSNPLALIVNIYIVNPTTPYEWNAYYDTEDHNNLTIVYSDTIVPNNVIVTVTDLKSNLIVLNRSYFSTQNFTLDYHDESGVGSYQANVYINRLGGSIRDQRIVTSPRAYQIILPNDSYITWAISTIVLMVIAGMFTYAHAKRGALAVVTIAILFIIFKLLPANMMTAALLAALFAIMSLFSSRV